MPCAVESPTATHNGPPPCRARSFDSSQYCRYSLSRPSVAATPGRNVRISLPVRKLIARILPAVGGDPALRAELKAMADRDTDAGGPIEDAEHVAVRRERVGLTTLAGQAREMRAQYQRRVTR